MDSPNPSVQTPRRPSVYRSHAHHLLPNQPEEKVRLMCSYGGQIVPRPHDKSLCYVGGDTRIVAVHRHSSLPELFLRLSRALRLHARPFILKYLLPSQDLDSLISITHDEDLQLMIQEYDCLTAVSLLKPSRLRLFLFSCDQPETAISIHDANKETWFVDAINDSDAFSVDCSAAVIQSNKQIKSLADVKAVSDSLVGDTPPCGSLSWSPSMFNLPPQGVVHSGGRLKQQQCRMEEQELFAKLISATTDVMERDDGFSVSSAASAPPVMITGHNNMNEVTCDAQASKLTPYALQPARARTSDALSLLSPYSVARIASRSNIRSEVCGIRGDKVEERGYCRLQSQAYQDDEVEHLVHYVQQAAIPCYHAFIPVLPTHPIGGFASTVYNNTASDPAFLQPAAQFQQYYHVVFPQLQSNIAFLPTPHGFEYQSTANFQK